MNDTSVFLLFLVIGYGLIWVGIVGYVMYVGARLRAIERDLEDFRNQDSDLAGSLFMSDVDED